MKILNLTAAAVLAISASSIHAQPASTPASGNAAPAATALADGEVRKVDKDAGKLTLRHGPIAKLDMPGMTMVFKVADPKMLDALKEGDKVRFSADRINGAMTVTAIEVAP
jgi:Cu/Ag efflux protein CusF